MKIVKSLLVAAVATLTLVSCQIKMSEDINPHKETRNVHFVVNSSAPQTKSYIDNQLDGTYNVGWNAEDELAIFFGTVSKDNSDKADAIFTNTSEKGETASFEGDAEVESTEGTFLSFYPASALAKTYSGTVGVTVKDCQEPTYDSYDPSCDILVARPCTYLADEDEIIINDLYFTRIMSVLKVNLVSSFDELSDDIVKYFKMEVPSDYILTGRPAVNLETAKVTTWNIGKSYVEAKFNNNDVKVNTELENSVYLIVNPVTLASGSDLAFTIETENYNITKNARLSKDMVFRQGNISVINLNITEPDCEPKAAPKTIPYEEDFTKSEGSFTIDNVSLGDITYVWSLDNTYGFKASAFVNKSAHETESWIVSPIIDLSNASGAVLTFDQALNNLKAGVRKDYVDVLIKVDNQDWETLSIDAYPAGSDWNFITSSVNLYPFIGSKIKIGFKYTSSSSIAPTWEIKNFSVKEPVTTLAFDITEKQIFVGGSFENVAKTNSPATVTYTSSNSSIATVTGTGTITGVSTGTCTITASVESYQGYPAKEATCSIEVLEDTSEKWIETPLSDITSNAVFVIVGDNGSTYAMSNNNGTTAAPSATAVTISDGKISSVVANIIKWNLTKSGNQYIFYPNGNHNTWLYCTDDNNGLKVGDGEENAFVVDEESGYLVNVTRNRYVGIYNNQDWRSYTSINNNIKDQSFSFYVLDGTNTKPTTVAVTGVKLDKTTASVAVNGTVTLTATVAPANATNKNVTWTSSDESKATVDQNGVVTGVAAGTATITVTTTDGGYTATCAVTVTAGGEQGGDNTPIELTFTLNSNPGGWPTTNSTTLTNYTYTLNNTDYTFGLKNVKCNSGYLMLTSTAVLGLPAIEGKKLTKVVAKNSSGCSTSTKVGVSSSSSSASYISGGAIQTWSTTSSTYTYNLTGTTNNTVYYLYVINKNAQIVELTLTYE